MKKSILKITMLTISLGLVFIACEKSNDELYEEKNLEINESPTEDAVLTDKVSFSSKEVARIHKDGFEYKFISIGNDGDMLVREISKGHHKKSNIGKDDKPIDIFLKITSANVDIPLSIAKTASNSEIKNSGRKVTKQNTPLKILDQNFQGIQIYGSCLADVGETTFENVYCQAPIVSTANNIEHCDENLETSLTRSSYFGGGWEDSDFVTAVTNFCGDTRIQFYSWRLNGSTFAWMLDIEYEYLSDGTETNVYFSPLNTERKVVRTSLGNGSFRAFTRFNNLLP